MKLQRMSQALNRLKLSFQSENNTDMRSASDAGRFPVYIVLRMEHRPSCMPGEHSPGNYTPTPVVVRNGSQGLAHDRGVPAAELHPGLLRGYVSRAAPAGVHV